MKSIIILIAASCLSNCIAQDVQEISESTLESVQIIFRHGQKLPDSGLGVRSGLLSSIGKQEMYDLGRLIRARYGNFISEAYDPSETRIISSASRRCIQSGALLAYGLNSEYNARANWSTGTSISIPYDPIPVESIPEEFDKWLQLTNDCPRRDQLKNQFMDDFFEEFAQTPKMAEFLVAYMNATGDLTPLNTSLGMTERIYPSTKYFDPSVNNSAPWASPYRESTMFEDLKFGLDKAQSQSIELMQLQRGPLFKMIFDEMSSVDSRKLTAYATHDFSLTVIKELFAEELQHFPTDPPTGSAFFLEVHRIDASSTPLLEIYFRNGTSTMLKKVENIPGCSSVCLIIDFQNLIQPFFPTDYAAQCIGNLSGENDFKSTVVLILLTTTAVVALVIAAVVLLRRSHRFAYQTIK